MNIQAIKLVWAGQGIGREWMCTKDDPIQLDDFPGCDAFYQVRNPEKTDVFYFRPDKPEETEPRCDYLLFVPANGDVRLIELKGGDNPDRNKPRGPGAWAHAFDQLRQTFCAYRGYLENGDSVTFVLCTSWNRAKPPYARFKQYTAYRKLRDLVERDIVILYEDEWDNPLDGKNIS